MATINKKPVEQLKTPTPRDVVYDFLLKLEPKPGVNACFIQVDSVGRIVNRGINDGCHYSFKSISGSHTIGSAFKPSDEEWETYGKALFDWINDPNLSPWRIFTPYLEWVFDPKRNIPLGWIAGPEIVESVHFNFLKNFAIFCRNSTEKHYCFRVWKRLVDKGLDPRDAFYLCVYFKITDESSTEIYRWSVPDGGHWCLTDYHTGSRYKLDWEKYQSGCISTAISPPINGYFITEEEKKKYSRFSWDGMKPERRQSKFGGTLEIYDIDDIIEHFKQWKEKHVKVQD